MATAFDRTPAELLGVRDPWAAYQVNSACLTWGRWVENKLSERNNKGKRKYTVAQLLREPERERELEKASSQTARAARGMVRRTVRVRPDGTWD